MNHSSTSGPGEQSRPPPPVPPRTAICVRHLAPPGSPSGQDEAPRGEVGPAGTLVRGGGSRPEREAGSHRTEPGRAAASFRAAPSVLRLRVARSGPGPGERAAGAGPHRRYSVPYFSSGSSRPFPWELCASPACSLAQGY